MENRQGVEKIMTVFDVTDCSLVNSTPEDPTRVMLIYERGDNRKHFTILARKMPQHLKAEVATWLDQNFDLNRTLCNA